MTTAVVGYAEMKRITITLPDYIYDFLRRKVKPGWISDFVVKAIQTRIAGAVITKNEGPWEVFLSWREKLPKYSTQEILQTIHEGRK